MRKVTESVYITFVALLLLAATTACNSDNDIPFEPEPGLSGMRPPTVNSSEYADCVFEWMPAPGQFINEPLPEMEWTASTTAAEATLWAQNRLQEHEFVSLGAFGGYIVTGFDHSVVNTGSGYELGIIGNSFNSGLGHSNEPGIVYVMQDTNGNGLPDDTWYELRGSDTLSETTVRNYAVTYYRPEADGQPVEWTDNLGETGEVPYVEMFHSQPTYYPVWVKADSYTLKGTRLASHNSIDPSTGYWTNPPYDWGYVDNQGADNVKFLDFANCNRFRISDAIDSSGKPVKLPYIDFVKVQTGVCSASGWLGEVSTEVMGIVDLTF